MTIRRIPYPTLEEIRKATGLPPLSAGHDVLIEILADLAAQDLERTKLLDTELKAKDAAQEPPKTGKSAGRSKP
jgi:hypothetical protein